MKKISITIIILILMMGLANGKESKVKWIGLLDGTDWKEMSEENKVFWIMGFMAGSDLIIENSRVSSTKSMAAMKEKEIIELCSSYLKSFTEIQKTFGIYEMTLDQLVKRMDQLYQNKKNQKIRMVDAVYIAKMEIEKRRPELVEAEKNYLRMQPVDGMTEASKILLDYSDAKYFKELYIKEGYLAEPKIDKPKKLEDYHLTPLFRYGTYK